MPPSRVTVAEGLGPLAWGAFVLTPAYHRQPRGGNGGGLGLQGVRCLISICLDCIHAYACLSSPSLF
jgi:hypothetical protein